MKIQKAYKIIIISDLHLSMDDSSLKEILNFVSNIQTYALIESSDIK